MKALSIRQPWAWAILHAGKRIENRSRADGRAPDLCRYIGPLLIHASKGCGIEEYADAAMWMHEQHLATPIEWRLDRQHADTPKLQVLSTLHRGGVVGRCNVVGYVGPTGEIYRGDGTRGPLPGVDMRWHVAGSYGLVLADVRPLPFVPFKGALGFFEVPDSLVPEAFRGVDSAARRGKGG